MPDTFGLSNEPLAPQRWSIPEKELNADFAQSVVTRKARAAGLPMEDAILEGIKGRQTATDPFYELKKLEFQSRIADHAAEAANRIRVLKMKEAETIAEQQDQTELMNIALRFKGKPKEALDAIGSFSPRSQLGVRAASEQRLAIVGLMDHDQEAKNLSSLSYADRRKYKIALNQNGGVPNEETDAILDSGLSHQATPTAITLGNGRIVNGWTSKGKFTADPMELIDARDLSVQSHIDQRGQIQSDLIDKRFQNQQGMEGIRFKNQQSLMQDKEFWKTLDAKEKTLLDRMAKNHQSLLRMRENYQKAGVLENDPRMGKLNADIYNVIRGQQALLDAIKPERVAPSYNGESDSNPAPSTPALAAPEKVRVKGPNGQTGTVPKGASLPEGWSLE